MGTEVKSEEIRSVTNGNIEAIPKINIISKPETNGNSEPATNGHITPETNGQIEPEGNEDSEPEVEMTLISSPTEVASVPKKRSDSETDEGNSLMSEDEKSYRKYVTITATVNSQWKQEAL